MEHPGIVLKKEMEQSGMSRKELSIRTGVSEKHICTVLNGDHNISVGFARKLGYIFQNPRFWMDLQNNYDEEQMRISEENDITDEELSILKPLQEIMAFLLERGYIHNNCGDVSKVMQLRKLLGISNLTNIPKIAYNASYRAQLTENVKVDPYVLFTWQKLCEKETEKVHISESINVKLLNDCLGEIKEQMFGDINNVILTLQNIFAKCGIAFQVVKNFRGAPVQGFIKETLDKRLILCLTIRRQRADTFWFTLFHEIAHILYGDYSARFIDFDSIQNDIENRADKFASDYLIESALYRKFLSTKRSIAWEDIENFAKEAQVQPYIVLGRLQNDRILDWSDYADKIVRYTWA